MANGTCVKNKLFPELHVVEVGENHQKFIDSFTNVVKLFHLEIAAEFVAFLKLCHQIFVLTRSLILHRPLMFLCLGYKIIQILIVFLMRLQDALCVFKLLYVHSKYSRSNISINPLFLLANAKERWILLAGSQIDTIFFLFKHCMYKSAK